MFSFVFIGVMVEQAFKDLPKHMKTLSETAVIVGRDLVDRFWKAKAEIDRRVAEIQAQQKDTKSSSTKTSNATSLRKRQIIKKIHCFYSEINDSKLNRKAENNWFV